MGTIAVGWRFGMFTITNSYFFSFGNFKHTGHNPNPNVLSVAKGFGFTVTTTTPGIISWL